MDKLVNNADGSSLFFRNDRQLLPHFLPKKTKRQGSGYSPLTLGVRASHRARAPRQSVPGEGTALSP